MPWAINLIRAELQRETPGTYSSLVEVAVIPTEREIPVALLLHYQLPAGMTRNAGGGVFQYRLLVQKQPVLERGDPMVSAHVRRFSSPALPSS